MSESRRYEFEEDGSSKFWEIEINDCDVTTRWGRIGSNGQSKTKSFASPAVAQKEHDKLVREKTTKGYRSIGASATAAKPAVQASVKPAGQVAASQESLSAASQRIAADHAPIQAQPAQEVLASADALNASESNESSLVAKAALDPHSTTINVDTYIASNTQSVPIQLEPIPESQFTSVASVKQWMAQAEVLGCRAAGFFSNSIAKISVAGYQKPPNTLVAIIDFDGHTWCEVVSFYSDKTCTAWSNAPVNEPKHDWLDMDHDPRMNLNTLVVASSNAFPNGKRDIVPLAQFAKYYSDYLTRKRLPAFTDGSAIQKNTATLSASEQLDEEIMTFSKELLRLMSFSKEFMQLYQRNSAAIDSVPMGKALLSRSPEELVQVLVASFRLTKRVVNRTGYDVLLPLRLGLLKKRLPLREADVELLCAELDKEAKERHAIDGTILAAIEFAAKSQSLTPQAKLNLRSSRDLAHDSYTVEKQGPYQVRIDKLLGELGQRIPIVEEGTPWTKEFIRKLGEMPPEKRKAWSDLLSHCNGATSSKATASWRKEALVLFRDVGSEAFHEMLSTWPPLLGKVDVVRDGGNAFLGNQDILRGLIWCCAFEPNERTAVLLRQIGVAAFKPLISLGPRTRVGNACVQVLGELGNKEAVSQLAVLRTKVKNGSAQRAIAKQLEETARKLGVSESELEEISVPTLGMEDVGLREDILGSFTAKLVVTHAGAELNWFRSDGSPQKSVPSEVKSSHAEELKELKEAVKDIDSILSAQRSRLESLYCIPHGWSFATWKDRYLDHPLVGVLARNLIWQFTDGSSVASAIWHQGHLVTNTGSIFAPTDTAIVRLWHPLNEPTDQVLAWRTWLIDNELQQPFKQAHREIYLLTEAERRTGNYSNRFAAHFLRQSQFRSLAQTRRWKVNFMGGFDGGDEGVARRDFPHHDYSVEFSLNAAGAIDPAGYGYAYGSSDQVRFFHPMTNLQSVVLENVPPMILSEAMRDVDLFVGVCSIGNDPNWIDAGNRREEFNQYWRDQAEADLTESGKMRRTVLEQIIPRLKIASQCELGDRVLIVQGKLYKYRIHLGSGNIMIDHTNQYLCIVTAVGGSPRTDSIRLPFAGDNLLSIILSKAFLLAADDKITDKTILKQLSR